MYKSVAIYMVSAVLAIAAAMAASYVYMTVTVSGSGMEPVLYDGYKVLVNKLAFEEHGDSPQVGDLVAFRSDVYGEEGEGSILVRRVAGAAGDTVEIKDGMFYLNDKPYQEYMKESVHMDDMARMRLDSDELFVLSDNRKSSMDSRNEAIGVLNIKDCVGKVTMKWRGIT
ncbi:MAG: signal peptidase I [Bacillota bacterium]|nr:signal peptidase I [Bacillota bacterium]